MDRIWTKNEEEVASLIALAKTGQVDVAAVGNEIIYRGELEESALIEYIEQVKSAIPGVPWGTLTPITRLPIAQRLPRRVT